MSQAALSILWFIVALGLLVTFHEFGHFIVARAFGVRVLRFSVGFGKPLLSRRGKSGTEYVVAAIPLGGYVKFLDEREGPVRSDELDQSFSAKPVWQRIAIVAAGPAFNVVLCFALLWLMFVIGKGDFVPRLGPTTGIAATAGLLEGDRIVSVDGTQTPTWTHAATELAIAGIDRRATRIEVERGSGSRSVTLPFAELPADSDETRLMQAAGLAPVWVDPPPVIGALVDGGPAAMAGLAAGDLITAIGDQPIARWRDIGPAIAAATEASAGHAVAVDFERNGRTQRVQLVPVPAADSDATKQASRPILGIEHRTETVLLRYGPIEAIGAAWRETGDMAAKFVGLLRRMLTGAASLANVSGPITIAQYAGIHASLGVDWYLSFLALLSMSLGLMNLLPVPILDGGHLLYYLIESIRGRPASERMLLVGQYIGLALLAGLMSLAFYNDIARLLAD